FKDIVCTNNSATSTSLAHTCAHNNCCITDRPVRDMRWCDGCHWAPWWCRHEWRRVLRVSSGHLWEVVTLCESGV
ncbi:MAG: hypothetical protein ACK559_22845, partial [bacterium]